eukprot:TRINITY_DN3700_c0_g1_i2.p1 TRINITY_DN3700_c0_g1~~TRINITY_DN3700_c0_g1_i2.p1  ORF type:complete len:151 (-),score=34.05 TRINITY_DN3700_c0_g1_i2:155-571(-)
MDISDSQLKDAYNEVRDTFDKNWALFGYEGSNKLVVRGSGTGGLDELKTQLQDDEVLFAYLRVTTGEAENERKRFVYILWVGEKVAPLKRAKVSVHKPSVKQIIQNYTFEKHAETLDDLDEQALLNKLSEIKSCAEVQ